MNRVREYRKRARMQQKELAALVGVSQPSVSEWELQKKDPSGSRLARLCEIFECKEDDILLPTYFDPFRNLMGQPMFPDPNQAVYMQERIRRKPEMQSLFEAADASTAEQIAAATELLKNPSGTPPPDTPRTSEARILSAGIDKMPPEDRERALSMMRLVFAQYADYFEGDDDN